jgi:hypothetical protein
MKLNHTLALAALASIGVSASAATTTDWGPLGPTADVAYVTYHAPGAVDDLYTFTLSGTSNVDAYGEEFESRSVTMPGASFTLFSGAPGSGTMVGAPFTFTNTPTETVYTSLASGSYYFEVSGTAENAGSAYDFEAFVTSGTGGHSAVPEPASAALLLAGLGMMGFLAGRRRRS